MVARPSGQALRVTRAEQGNARVSGLGSRRGFATAVVLSALLLMGTRAPAGEVVRAALEAGVRPRCHFEDITRADFYGFCVPFAQALMDLSAESGVPIKIRLCDTLGFGVPYPAAALPRSVPKLVQVRPPSRVPQRTTRPIPEGPTESTSYSNSNSRELTICEGPSVVAVAAGAGPVALLASGVCAWGAPYWLPMGG